jgi:hypothetical protein
VKPGVAEPRIGGLALVGTAAAVVPGLADHRARAYRLRLWGRCWLVGHAYILGLVDQDDHPRDHFGDEEHGADPERAGQPPELLSVQRGAIAHVEC